jgi:hypothetical protein
LGFVHGTVEIVGEELEHLLLSAFAGAFDKIATARPATKSKVAFMGYLLANSGTANSIPERYARSIYRRLRPASISKQATALKR